ncbi:MAG: GAF domain-containing sensor histidine kinase [Mucilaginibacter sp.]|nr:GAF domain-containing sensor histidine kinase [Mucilaginibacter sp.]
MDNVFGIDIIPDNDAERVAALEHYQIINTHREKAFDSICALACELFGCPISHISFLDADTEYIKAACGLDGIAKVSRSIGFCAVAVLEPELLIVEDTLLNNLFSNHPYVVDKLQIRFYAGAPIITPDGFIIGTICLIDTAPRKFSDSEKRILKKLANLVMEQTELRYNNLSLIQQRDEFIAIASHEMRTPLTSLQASLQFINENNDSSLNATNQRMLQHAYRNAEKLSHLVNEMFEASRIAERQFSINKSIFNLAELTDSCCGVFTQTGKHQLVTHGEKYIQVNADRQKIEQVVVNLVGNAVKYAPQSKIISIDIEYLGSEVKMSVTDTGPGIEPDKLPHIFRRFYRTDNNLTQTGLGLGLYICAEIIREHGGEIGVSSNVGEGSTFWFTLPLNS